MDVERKECLSVNMTQTSYVYVGWYNRALFHKIGFYFLQKPQKGFFEAKSEWLRRLERKYLEAVAPFSGNE